MNQRLGPYELLCLLATGGMAEIYAARRAAAPHELSVIKRMLPQFSSNPAFVEMFFDEGRTTSLLDHPNVVRMRYFGFEGDTPYLEMEYLHGVDVRTLLRARSEAATPLPVPIALAIADGVCAGLHHAHQARNLDGRPLDLVHRDVSPQNVFVTFAGEVKLIDFGIARVRGRAHQTRGGTLKGKIPYMAPEQIRDGELDRRTDVYAVGVMLYELLTFRRPYVIEDGQAPQGEFALMMAIVGHQVAALLDLAPDRPTCLEPIVMRALAARPADRFATAAELQAELARAAHKIGPIASRQELADFLAEAFPEDAPLPLPHADTHELVTRIESSRALRESAWTSETEEWKTENLRRESSSAAAPELAVRTLTLPARLEDGFSQVEVAAAITGPTVIDLGAVHTVSAAGVRRWRDLQGALARRASPPDLYYVQCSHALLSRLGLLRSPDGVGRVVSFLAPYHCARCGDELDRLFDCERDAAALERGALPTHPCPRCGAAAAFDDDASGLAALRPILGVPLPPQVRAVVDGLAAADNPTRAADKRVDGNHTRLRMLRAVDSGFRWSRLLDGVEGKLELDLRHLGEDPAALGNLASALRDLDEAVVDVRIVAAPPALASLVVSGSKVRIDTVLVRGTCPACATIRLAELTAEGYEQRAPRALSAQCRRCASALRFEPPTRASAAAPAPAPPPEAQPRRARRSSAVLVVAVIALALAVALASQLARGAPVSAAPCRGAPC